MTDAELSQQQIDTLKDLLEASKQEIENHLDRGNSATKPVTLDQQSVGRVSRIDAIQQQQMALASQQQSTQMLKRIQFALQRIEDGVYGYCLHCEEPIAFARLQAQPFASLCLECKSASENA